MRPTLDETMMRVATVLAARGTCAKMQVGCVLTDGRGMIMAANYNGVASGRPHCNAMREIAGDRPGTVVGWDFPHKCAGADAPPGSDLCEAVHAEQNALTWCHDAGRIDTCYSTVSPCMRCVKQLLNTPCWRIVFAREYDREPQARELWLSAGRVWLPLPISRASKRTGR